MDMDRLKSSVRLVTMLTATHFNILAEIPSQPVDFVTFRIIKWSRIDSSVQRISSGHAAGSRCEVDLKTVTECVSGGMLWLKHPKKKVLRESALPAADTIVLPLHSRDGIDIFLLVRSHTVFQNIF